MGWFARQRGAGNQLVNGISQQDRTIFSRNRFKDSLQERLLKGFRVGYIVQFGIEPDEHTQVLRPPLESTVFKAGVPSKEEGVQRVHLNGFRGDQALGFAILNGHGRGKRNTSFLHQEVKTNMPNLDLVPVFQVSLCSRSA